MDRRCAAALASAATELRDKSEAARELAERLVESAVVPNQHTHTLAHWQPRAGRCGLGLLGAPTQEEHSGGGPGWDITHEVGPGKHPGAAQAPSTVRGGAARPP